jgi:hypothetical protein
MKASIMSKSSYADKANADKIGAAWVRSQQKGGRDIKQLPSDELPNGRWAYSYEADMTVKN